MLHRHKNCRCLLLQKYTIIDLSLHNKVNVKQIMYSNSSYVAYLHELTFRFLRQSYEAAGPEKNGILLFVLIH
jgi:hypothetical protein